MSVLRDRRFVAARMVHAASVAFFGTGVTFFGGPEWTIAPGVILVIAGLILARVGLTIGS